MVLKTSYKITCFCFPVIQNLQLTGLFTIERETRKAFKMFFFELVQEYISLYL